MVSDEFLDDDQIAASYSDDDVTTPPISDDFTTDVDSAQYDFTTEGDDTFMGEQVDDPARTGGGHQTQGTSDGSPVYDDELLEFARDLGFSEEQAKSFGGPNQLSAVLGAVSQKILASQRAETKQQINEAAKPTGRSQEFELQKLDLKALGVTEDKFDEPFIEVMNKMNDFYQGQIEQLQKGVGQVLMNTKQQEAVIQQANAHMLEQQFDSAVAGLPDEVREIFGNGPTRALDPNGPEAQWRNKLVDEVAMRALWQRQKNPNAQVNLAKVIETAAHSLTGKQSKEIARKAVAKQLNGRARLAVGKPEQRVGKPVDPLAAAIRFAEEHHR